MLRPVISTKHAAENPPRGVIYCVLRLPINVSSN
jgi:hypothetical protein